MHLDVEKTPIHVPRRRPGAVLRVDLQDKGTGRVARSSFPQEQLVAVINGPGSTQDKRRMLTQIIDSAVDVDGVAQFCLGRFWRQTSPQQQRIVILFHQVLVSNIMAKLGEYQGVKFTVGRSHRQGEDEIVSSVAERPNNPSINVDWEISDPDNNPKIIDVIAGGTFGSPSAATTRPTWRTIASMR